MEGINSLYFLSSANDESILNYKIRKYMIMSKTFDFLKCIKNLEETERIKIIRNKDKDTFLLENSNIFFDSNINKIPACDILYTKINKNYFVKNDEYFEKTSLFYFKLYSTIFSSLGLNEIKMNISNIIDESCNVNVDMNMVVSSLGAEATNQLIHKNENNIVMTFPENISDRKVMENINNSEDKVKYIHSLFPENLQNTIYEPSIFNQLDFIERRTINELKSVNKNIIIENTNTKKLKIKLTENFNVGNDFGLLMGYSHNKYIKNEIKFDISFHDLIQMEHNNAIEIIQPPSPTSTPPPSPESTPPSSHTSFIIENNIYVSAQSYLNGPWPINCNEIFTKNGVSYNEGKEFADIYILKDPVNTIVEIVKDSISTYKIKVYKVIPGNITDVIIGKGMRYVVFDIDRFIHKDIVVNTLKENDFY